jgi:glycosyltransferase involved in cell wall biosynthesis
LSWSLLEAMSTGCLVVASDTAPVREVVDGRNGLLVPFLDPDRLAETVIEALARPNRFKKHRSRARETILARYDAKRVCLPRMLDFLGLADEAQKITTADLAVSEQA